MNIMIVIVSFPNLMNCWIQFDWWQMTPLLIYDWFLHNLFPWQWVTMFHWSILFIVILMNFDLIICNFQNVSPLIFVWIIDLFFILLFILISVLLCVVSDRPDRRWFTCFFRMNFILVLNMHVWYMFL